MAKSHYQFKKRQKELDKKKKKDEKRQRKLENTAGESDEIETGAPPVITEAGMEDDARQTPELNNDNN